MMSTIFIIIGLAFGVSFIFICICVGINYFHTDDDFEIEDAVINEILTRNHNKSIEIVPENMVDV